jgi:hypothetical protein
MNADMRFHVMQGAKYTRKRSSVAPSEVPSKKVKVRAGVATMAILSDGPSKKVKVRAGFATMAILSDEDRDDSAIPFLLSVKPIKKG